MRSATRSIEEPTVAAAVFTLAHPLKPASITEMGTRLKRMIVFMI
jgi:hypothetical protein